MKGLPYSLRRGSKAAAPINKMVVHKSVVLSIDGATGVGFGTAVIGDLPEGNILLLGAAAYCQITEADAGITATFTGNFSVGSTPTADATLAGTDVDIIPSTALAAATASVSPRTRAVNATQAILDNTDGAMELNLNVLIADAEISADDAVATAVVDLFISYVVLGDD